MAEIEVEIDDEVFLPKYRHLTYSDADIIVLWGGRDSGKTHNIAQNLVKDCLENDYFKCILSRKVQDTIKESQYATIKDIITEWGLLDLFEFRVNPLEIRCVNGNKFIARGADKSGKSKGIKDPTHSWFEEMNQISEEEYAIVSTTLRSSKTKIKEYWSFNPECDGEYRDFWLFKVTKDIYEDQRVSQVVSVGGDNVEIIYEIVHSTYEDNPYCPPERKAKYLNTTKGNTYLYDVWIKGWWGNKEVQRPFAHAYDEKLHVGIAKFNPLAQTIVTVDFNVDPFCANIFNLWRKDGLNHCHQVDEIEVIGGTLNELSNRIKTIVGPGITTMLLGGDAMGNNRTIGATDNKSLFQRLIEELKISPRQLKVVANPGHSTSREDVNYFLQNYPDFKIGEHCAGTRRDMRSVQVDLYGSIIKRNRKDESQRADFIDNIRYLVNTFFKKEIEFHRKHGYWP